MTLLSRPTGYENDSIYTPFSHRTSYLRVRVPGCSCLYNRRVSQGLPYGTSNVIRGNKGVEHGTYPFCTRSTKLPLQTTFVLLWIRRLVGQGCLDKEVRAYYEREEGGPADKSLARLHVRILVGAEDAQQVIVLVHGLAKVPPFLLVPPVGVRVAELPLDERWVDVASVLASGRQPMLNEVRSKYCSRAHHSRVLLVGIFRVVGILLIQDVPGLRMRRGKERPLLDQRQLPELRKRSAGPTTERRRNSARQHLQNGRG